MRASGATFEPLGIPCLIHEKPVRAGAEKRAQASLAEVVRIEEFLFQKTGEEVLREVGGVFPLDAPLHAHVLVDGFPICSGDGVDRPRTLGRIVALRRQYHRMARQREASVL